MPQSLRNYLGMNPALKHQSGMGMPEVMEPYMRRLSSASLPARQQPRPTWNRQVKCPSATIAAPMNSWSLSSSPIKRPADPGGNGSVSSVTGGTGPTARMPSASRYQRGWGPQGPRPFFCRGKPRARFPRLLSPSPQAIIPRSQANLFVLTVLARSHMICVNR